MKYSAVIRRSKSPPTRKRKFLITAFVIVLALGGFVAAELTAPSVVAWRQIDFEQSTRRELLETAPGHPALHDGDALFDEWMDTGGLIDKTLLVFMNREENAPPFSHNDTPYKNYPIAAAIISYSVTLPVVGYVGIYSEWLYPID